jgi:hypothetical protein
MKQLTVCFVIVLSFFAVPAHSWDGEISFGKFFGSTLDAGPAPIVDHAQYQATIEVGYMMQLWTGDNLRFHVRPWTEVRTLMDERSSSYTFHPSSVRYTVGAQFNILKIKDTRLWLDASHQCWHPVDDKARGDTVQRYDYLGLRVTFGKRY